MHVLYYYAFQTLKSRHLIRDLQSFNLEFIPLIYFILPTKYINIIEHFFFDYEERIQVRKFLLFDSYHLSSNFISVLKIIFLIPLYFKLLTMIIQLID